jgi:VanZ family protein
MRRALLIVVALILYGSLYPWHFHARHLAGSPLWILLHSWPAAVNRYILWDVAVNVVLYVPFGIFGFLSMRDGAPPALRMAVPLALALALSASVEMLQIFDVTRECSASDVVSNVAGAALGIGLGALYRGKLRRVLERREAASLLHPSAALLLLCCWLGYQLFPLFPAFGRTGLAAKLAAMGPLSAISPDGTLLIFAEWLAVACLLDTLLEKSAGRPLALLLLVLPARLLIVSRNLSWADLLGALAAWAVWVAFPRRPVRRAVPFLLAGALLLNELAPFHLARAAPFHWVPFRGLFEAPWQNGMTVLFRKSFWYGSLIWLWRSAGRGLAPATAAVAAALFLLESVQIYLPGRVPEVSDAILAVLMGVLLWLLNSPPATAA